MNQLLYGSFSTFTTTVAASINQRTNFSDAWSRVWNAIVRGIGGDSLNLIMNSIGILLILAALIGYFWQHRRGTGWGNGATGIVGAGVIGLVLLAPNIILPLALRIVDWVVNIVLRLFRGAIRNSSGTGAFYDVGGGGILPGLGL
ncbi:hypothetical protein [Nesterenkonia rhizosphaerae]|uniref:Uncharacterized protein n=1 Tax=Nesterenkonia rhizosphaerae TaxID=1348272 RepID=A0ABP9G1Y1_9MICC